MSNVSDRLWKIKNLSEHKMELSIINHMGILKYADLNIAKPFTKLLNSRVWLYIRIKNNSSVLMKFDYVDDDNDNDYYDSNILFYKEGKDGMIRIEQLLPWALLQELISDEDILNAIKINLENPFIEWENIVDDTIKKVTWITGEYQ